jgi:hypothetical protein
MHNFSDADLPIVRPLIVPAEYGRHNNFPAPLIPLSGDGSRAYVGGIDRP